MSHTMPEPHYGQPMTGENPMNVQQYINPVGEAPVQQAPVQQYTAPAPVQNAPEMVQHIPTMSHPPVTDVQVQTTAPVEPQVNPQPMSQNVSSVPAPAPMEAPAAIPNINSQAEIAPMSAPVDPNNGMYQAPVQQYNAPAPIQQTQVDPNNGMYQAPMQQAPVQQYNAPAPMQQAPMQQQYNAPAPMQQQYNAAAPMQQAPMQQAPMQQAPMQQYNAPAPGSSAPGYSNQPYMDMNAVGLQTPTGHPLKTKFTGEAILVAGKTLLNKKGNKMAMGMINPTPGVPNTPTFRFICFSATSAKQIDVVESPQYAQYIQVKKLSGSRIQFTGSWEENTYNGNTSLQLMMDEFVFTADPNIKGYAENYIDPAPVNPMDMLNGGNVGGVPQMPGQVPGYNPQGHYQAPQGQPYNPQGQVPQGQYQAPQGQPYNTPGQVQQGQVQQGQVPQYHQNQIPGVPPLPNIPGIQQ